MRLKSRRSAILLPVVTLFVVGIGTVPSAAAPMPTRDIKQVQAQVEDLQMQAASANEKYNNAQDRLASTRGKLSAIQGKVAREKDELSQAMASVNDLARGVYTGTIGYLGLGGAADFNVAIRTIVLADGVATFHVGGAIVAASQPAAEYEETLDKAEGLVQAILAEGAPR